MIALALAPLTVSISCQFLRPIVKGRIARSEAELSMGDQSVVQKHAQIFFVVQAIGKAFTCFAFGRGIILMLFCPCEERINLGLYCGLTPLFPLLGREVLEFFIQEINSGYLLQCSVYMEDTPNYQVFLVGEESGKKHKTETTIHNEKFTAEVRSPINEKCEIIIKFEKHGTAASGVYLNQSSIEYVPGIISEPRIVGEKIPDFVKEAVLLAYDPEYDVYVYQCQSKMHWLIGNEIDEGTEIIYLLFTDEVSKLPKNRIVYGFENLGFYLGGKNQKADVGNYKHFEAEIPDQYHVTAIRVGYNKDNQILWSQFIRKLP